jgi:hypothetical protein
MKPQTLIGRKPEIEVLNKALHSGESEMVALIGRRRVGKTFLVRQALFGRIDFELTGEQNTGMRQQLQNFADRMTFHTGQAVQIQRPGNWHEAFRMIVLWLKAARQSEKKALGIAAVHTVSSTFYLRGNEQQAGVQIDLMIERNDHAINVCELKFYKEEWLLTKATATEMRQKVAYFKAATQTKKQVFLTLISPFSLIPNEYSTGLVDVSLTMDAFFE